MFAFHARWSPDGSIVAAQLDAMHQRCAAIFDAEGRLVWAPQGVVDIAFAADGRELLVLGSRYTTDFESRHPGTAPQLSMFQADYAWYLARVRWPERTPVAEALLSFPTGVALDMTPSAHGERACVRFVDQCESGWVVVDVDAPAQRPTVVFERGSALLGAPVFSPDGRYVVGAMTSGGGWWLPPFSSKSTESDAVRAEQRAHRARGAAGGAALAGVLWIHDLREERVRDVELHVELPRGWGAAARENQTFELGPVRFVRDDLVEVTLPNGALRTVELP